MRKLIAIPLLVLYITAVSGMMIQLHFCGSKLLSWKVNQSEEKCCCRVASKEAKHDAEMALQLKSKDEGCCKSKTITLKIQQDQNRANQLQLKLASIQIIAPVIHQVQSVLFAPIERAHTSYQANAPPGRWQQIPLYLLHGSFTYYG